MSEANGGSASEERAGVGQRFNAETRRVLCKSEEGLEVERFDSAKALFEDLGV